MRAVVQRVKRTSVKVGGEVVAEIGSGLLIFLGIAHDDSEADIEYLAKKIPQLRIFEDDQGKMNLSLLDTLGEALVVSQFTLYGDCRKGRRPSFTEAAKPQDAIPIYEAFLRSLEAEGIKVKSGIFQAMMDVELINDGPVTILLDSKRLF